MRTLTLLLGDRTYTVPVAPIKRAAAWRKRLQGPLNEVLSLLTVDLAALSGVQELTALMQKFYPLLVSMPETLLDLIYAYAPALEADREVLDETVLDAEVIEAFIVIVRVAFPLERLTGLLGSANPPTLTSLPAPNGG